MRAAMQGLTARYKRGVMASALAVGVRFAAETQQYPFIIVGNTRRLDEMQRVLSWKTLDRLRRPFENLWSKRFETLLAPLAIRVASKYRATGSTSSTTAVIRSTMKAALPAMYRRLYNSVAETFGERAATAARRLLRQEQRADFFEETPGSRAWISAQTGQRIVDVTDATVAFVKNLIERSIVDGLTTDQIAAALVDASTFSKARAFRVARTEVVSASNAGNHFSTERFLPSARFVKKWLSSRDFRVRSSHIGADGKTVPLKGAFSLPGGKLRFPGDSTLGASAAEIVNCRCTTTYEPRKG